MKRKLIYRQGTFFFNVKPKYKKNLLNNNGFTDTTYNLIFEVQSFLLLELLLFTHLINLYFGPKYVNRLKNICLPVL